MPRTIVPYDSRRQEADDYRERNYQEKSTWKKYGKWALIGIAIIIIILFILSATGKLKGSNNDTIGDNQTTVEKPADSKYDQMTQYIISQQNEGMQKEEIVQRLTLAGFSEQEIETAYGLSDPTIQEILRLEKEGQTRQQIVESLLQKGITPEQIQEKYSFIDSTRTTSFSDTIKDNWFWILLAAIVIYFVYKNYKEDEKQEKLTAKVYTLDECEEYAREYLTKKGKTYNPSKQYRNRPDIRQYRFVYEEPLFAEFNDHLPTGQVAGKRRYFLIAIGYDREVIDWQETEDDNKINSFLYGAAKGFETSGSREYMSLRAHSEQPIEERTKREERDNDRYYDYRRPYTSRNYRRPYTGNRIRPGTVEGWEEP